MSSIRLSDVVDDRAAYSKLLKYRGVEGCTVRRGENCVLVAVEHHPVQVRAVIADGRLGLRSRKVFHTEQGDLWKTGHSETATKGRGKLAKLSLIDHATALAVPSEVDVFIVGPALKVPLIVDETGNLRTCSFDLRFVVATNLTSSATILVSLVPDTPAAPRRWVDDLDSFDVTVHTTLELISLTRRRTCTTATMQIDDDLVVGSLAFSLTGIAVQQSDCVLCPSNCDG